MFDLQTICSLVGTALMLAMGSYQTYLQYTSVKLMKATTKNKRADIKPKYWPLVAMTLVGVAIAWIPTLLPSQDVPTNYVRAWGWDAQDPNHKGSVLADGRALFSKHSKFRLAAVCFHYFGLGDPKDATNLSKSGLYDILQADIPIIIPYNDTFLAEWKQENKSGTNYYLLLVPIGIKMNQFDTIHEAEALGVQLIGQGSGPP
jgi:hypothetical protein